MRNNILNLTLVSFLILIIIPLAAYAQVPTNVYLNDSSTYTRGTPNASLTFNATGMRVNLDLSQNPIHFFEGQSVPGSYKWIVEYNSSNSTGYALKLWIDDEATALFDDKIGQYSCNSNSINVICSGNCGGFNFVNMNNFTVKFNSTDNTFKIFLGTSTIAAASGSLCSGFTSVGNIIFAPYSDSGSDQFTVDYNLVTANNRAPTFATSLQNITFPEDTATSINISGKFTDPDNQAINYSFSDLENISITINQTSGIANITPPANFYGIRYIRFYANDSQNITYSNNVTITVASINDPPNITSATLSNTDSYNRANGSLAGSWLFADIDNETMQSNEILWYINGTENAALRNLITINSGNLTKTQNWIFSVRVFDGLNFSGFVNSSSLLINNSAPTQSTPTITSNDGQNRRNGNLTCNNQTSDFDSDSITNFIKWHKNNTLIIEASNLNALYVGNFSKTDNITCEVTPFDGTVNGTAFTSAKFIIRNAAPLSNGSIGNLSWNQDTAAAINLNAGFLDIDSDDLTYNYTNVSNIGISINNVTGIATLTPDSGFTGARYVIFYAFDGTNLTASNSVNLTVNAVTPPPSSGNSGGTGSISSSSGGGGGSSFVTQCSFNWQCDEWTLCNNNKQTRSCRLVQVPDFTASGSCPQYIVPEQARDCSSNADGSSPSVKQESCNDNIQNQDESGTDCGGSCNPCAADNARASQQQSSSSSITGQAATNVTTKDNVFLALSTILFAGAITFYTRFSHKRIFRKEKLSRKEMEKLNKMLDYNMFKKE